MELKLQTFQCGQQQTLFQGIANELNYQLIGEIINLLEKDKLILQQRQEHREKQISDKLETHTQPMRSVFDTWFIENVKRVRAGHMLGPLTSYDISNICPPKDAFHPGKGKGKKSKREKMREKKSKQKTDKQTVISVTSADKPASVNSEKNGIETTTSESKDQIPKGKRSFEETTTVKFSGKP